MKITAYIAQSLDGYIAGLKGELDFLESIDNPEKNDFGFSHFMDSVDAVLMGKNTFEKVLSFSTWAYSKPVYVASNSLIQVPTELQDKAKILSGNLDTILLILYAHDVEHLYIDGGLLIQSALQQGKLDELIVTTLPIVLGDGIPLFGQSNKSIGLELISSAVYINQLVQTHYRVVK